MDFSLTDALLLLAAYLLGAVPCGYIIGRLHGLDIRTRGSGNIGATNLGRVLGKKWGVLCFLLDVAKGLAGNGDWAAACKELRSLITSA